MSAFTQMRLKKDGTSYRVCPNCGQKKHGRVRYKPVCIVKSLDKQWAVLAYPRRYSIVQLAPAYVHNGLRQVWKEKQRVPKNTKEYRSDECDAAVSAMHRRMREYDLKKQPIVRGIEDAYKPMNVYMLAKLVKKLIAR